MENAFPGKVLIVDDDPDITKLYSRTLIQAGFEVDTANSGKDGYAKILQGGYDVILLDTVMPDLDGIAILKQLSQKQLESADNKSTGGFSYNGSIIILSQINQAQFMDTAFGLGAKGYIVKADITPQELPTKIAEILAAPSK